MSLSNQSIKEKIYTEPGNQESSQQEERGCFPAHLQRALTFPQLMSQHLHRGMERPLHTKMPGCLPLESNRY